MRPSPFLSVALLLAATLGATATSAQPGGMQQAGSPEVTVVAGQALRLKAGDYSPRTVDDLTRRLASDVGQAISRGRASGTVSQVRLVLEDASPSLPRSHGGTEAGLGGSSIGLGGAWIDGYILTSDNKKRPVSYSFYGSDLPGGLETGMWSDADRAFTLLARDLARGDYPQETQQSGGDPQGGVARWPR